MPLFGRSQPPPLPRRRRNRTSSWLAREAKASENLIQKVKQGSPKLQAAIVTKATGVPLEKEDIRLTDPSEEIESRVAEAAMKDIETDPDFIQAYKDSIIDKIYAKGGVPARRRLMRRQDLQEGEQLEGIDPYGYQNQPQTPLEMIDMVDAIKEKVGGGGTMRGITDIVTSLAPILPLLLGSKNGGNQSVPQIAAPANLVAVEVDGQLVEMTRQGYEIYKRQRDRLKAIESGQPPPAENKNSVSTPADAVKSSSQPPPVVDNPIELDEKWRVQIIEASKVFLDNMDKKPDEFAELLDKWANTDQEPNALIVYNVLKTVSFEDGLSTLLRLKHYPDLLPLINKLEAKQEWVKSVMAAVKSDSEEK